MTPDNTPKNVDAVVKEIERQSEVISGALWYINPALMEACITALLTELERSIEEMRKWADEATPEQQHNIDTYNTALQEVLTLIKGMKGAPQQPSDI